MSRLSALTILAVLVGFGGCGGAKHPLSTDDGGAGVTGSAGAGGTGSGTGGIFGGGGSTSTGGDTGSTGGSTGGGTGGRTGGGGLGGGGFGGIPTLPDGGLNGILDSGLIGGCPANPANQSCGGAGNPMYCYTPAGDGGTPAACGCFMQRWVCVGQGGFPGGDGGQGLGGMQCPDNPAGMSCTMGAFCMRAGGGLCACFGAMGGAPTWRCTM